MIKKFKVNLLVLAMISNVLVANEMTIDDFTPEERIKITDNVNAFKIKQQQFANKQAAKDKEEAIRQAARDKEEAARYKENARQLAARDKEYQEENKRTQKAQAVKTQQNIKSKY